MQKGPRAGRWLVPSFPNLSGKSLQLEVGGDGEWFPALASLLLLQGWQEWAGFLCCDTMSLFLCVLSFCCLLLSISRGGWQQSVFGGMFCFSLAHLTQ